MPFLWFMLYSAKNSAEIVCSVVQRRLEGFVTMLGSRDVGSSTAQLFFAWGSLSPVLHWGVWF